MNAIDGGAKGSKSMNVGRLRKTTHTLAVGVKHMLYNDNATAVQKVNSALSELENKSKTSSPRKNR
jgi:acetyl-CoA carboxylase carboxyltransferase component